MLDRVKHNNLQYELNGLDKFIKLIQKLLFCTSQLIFKNLVIRKDAEV